MSMKRTKSSSRGTRDRDSESGPFSLSSAKPVETPKNWEQDVAGQADDAFLPYAMQTAFQPGALILHSKFGKGLVTAVEDKRIVVLFEEGTKKLGHAG